MTTFKTNKIEKIKKFKVMIVEDSPSTIKRYKDEIKDQHHASFFEDARTALNHYDNDYDLVITDLMLPLKSGEGLIFDIKYANPKQKIAVISGSPEFLKLQEYDNIQVFEKPVNICDVINCVLLGKALVRTDDGKYMRRKHPRFQVDLNASLFSNNFQKKTPVHVGNVSLGGLFIDNQLPPAIESETLPIELPLLERTLVVNTLKCWEKEGVGFGVKFQNLGHSEYSLLELYLESLRAESEL